MSAGAIIAIVIVAVLIVAFFAVVWPRMNARRLEQRREAASDHRQEASVRDARARRQSAAADERAARARREAAQADEAAQRARSERAVAEEHAERARDLDPDLEDEHDARTEDEKRDRARH